MVGQRATRFTPRSRGLRTLCRRPRTPLLYLSLRNQKRKTNRATGSNCGDTRKPKFAFGAKPASLCNSKALRTLSRACQHSGPTVLISLWCTVLLFSASAFANRVGRVRTVPSKTGSALNRKSGAEPLVGALDFLPSPGFWEGDQEPVSRRVASPPPPRQANSRQRAHRSHRHTVRVEGGR